MLRRKIGFADQFKVLVPQLPVVADGMAELGAEDGVRLAGSAKLWAYQYSYEMWLDRRTCRIPK